MTVEEMDLDAILKRKPQVVLVDELAHTNAPTSKNRKRYQDVLDLLDAGIHVIGAFNVQHLESLNDLVYRVTGVTVRETVPDSFLKNADQVVNLDLAVEDLLARLDAGQIYDREKIERALAGFFKPENLSTLRELSLREVAESLDRAGSRGAAAPRKGPRRPLREPGAGGDVLEPAARGDAAPEGLAARRPAEHRLVRGLRRDPEGGARP